MTTPLRTLALTGLVAFLPGWALDGSEVASPGREASREALAPGPIERQAAPTPASPEGLFGTPGDPHEIAFPLGTKARLLRDFGDPRGKSRRHEGMDLLAPKRTPVLAARAGTVRWMHDERGGRCCDLELEHEDGWRTRYIHLDNDTPGTDDGQGWGFADGIDVGTRVEAGQLIGYVGDSGNAESAGPHLHFELRSPDGRAVDPHDALSAAMTSL